MADDSLDEYASQLEDRIMKLENSLQNFRIAGPGISGDIETGFNYDGSTGRIEQGPEQTDEGQ